MRDFGNIDPALSLRFYILIPRLDQVLTAPCNSRPNPVGVATWISGNRFLSTFSVKFRPQIRPARGLDGSA